MNTNYNVPPYKEEEIEYPKKFGEADIKIAMNSYGLLYMYRASSNEYKKQFCPFSNMQESEECGDWCPLFTLYPEPPTDQYTLELCHRTYRHIDCYAVKDVRDGQ